MTDLRLAVTRARDNRERQVRLLDNLSGQVQRRRDEVERSLADIPSIQRDGLVNRAVGAIAPAFGWAYLPPDEPVDDALVAARGVEILRQHKPNVLLVHLPGVDTAGHEKGWGSPEQLAAVARADAALGVVLDAVRDAGLEPATLVIATADHGGAGRDHWGDDPRSRIIPWVARGPGVRRNHDLTRYIPLLVRTEDTFATACGALGIPIPADSDGRFVGEILQRRELLFPTTGPARPGTRPAR